ncbi:hypothetical protein DFJ74DRAFT_704404 [Hyaloraphidium curvatum]|nr:hypothetical protein DFJ74DRAFT_704404 [Hyaloraphidium curvatum]
MPPPNPAIPFAVLRNAHEGLRAGIKDMDEKVGKPAQFAEAWKEYQRALDVHAAMEDYEVFALLDELGNNAITNEHIRDEHTKDGELVAAVDAALASGDAAKLAAEFGKWKTYHLDHLVHEEKVMPPIVAKLGGGTAEGRARAFYERVVLPADQRNREEFAFMIGWMVKHMSAKGSTANTPSTAVRVFAHGLQAASSAEQWAAYLPVIKANCAPEIYEEMKTLYDIEAPGRQGAAA